MNRKWRGGRSWLSLARQVLEADRADGQWVVWRPAVAGFFAGLAAMAALLAFSEELTISDLAFVWVFAAASVLAGSALGSRTRRFAALEERAEAMEREREEEARIAVEHERARIARELHDVIAHSVSVMTLQAGAARMLLDQDPALVFEPVANVEETGGQALAELRRLLGVLRRDLAGPELEPQPGLGSIDALLAELREAGVPVELTVDGEPGSLPPGVDLAAFRVVEEALQNVRDHAGQTPTRVRVLYGERELELEIVNDEGAAANERDAGQGLVGVRERVALCGGELNAGRRRGGGYAVRARLPLERAP